jgi:hypothetical protein
VKCAYATSLVVANCGCYHARVQTTRIHAILLSLAALAACQSVMAAASDSCERLASNALPHAEISVAKSIPAGTFTPPYGGSLEKLPAFCRVAGISKPSSDSYIRFEVWLPASNWNGKFLGVGNGGFAGEIDYDGMAGVLKRGYATAATDTGHEADAEDATWAYKHPEKLIDFGYRGLHETTIAAKELIEAFYGKPAQHSYLDACSDGGREALMEAQRFPEDFDGILAGAPANYWTHLLTAGLALQRAISDDPAAFVSGVKVRAISAAVLDACDAQDGLRDGIIGDPVHCRFDPAVLLCKGPESRNCLTAPQVAALKRLYDGGKDSHGKQIFPGFLPGAEEGPGGWGPWIFGEAPETSAGAAFVRDYFRYTVFEDPAWNLATADVDQALRLADQKTARILNSTDPDLRRFHARGGKLILYHGWNDPAIPAPNTSHYYNAVLKTMDARTAQHFVRLYMVPGMQHCVGGPGASHFGQLGTTTAKGSEHGIYTALENWVEKGAPPGDIVATKYDDSNKAIMTRPLCPYPQIATYKGSGDPNDSSNFSCVDRD